jgi:hypothetical protein
LRIGKAVMNVLPVGIELLALGQRQAAAGFGVDIRGIHGYSLTARAAIHFSTPSRHCSLASAAVALWQYRRSNA